MEHKHYKSGVDVWAAGCIMGEMFHRSKPVFPGKDRIHQLDVILELVGVLPFAATTWHTAFLPLAQFACHKRHGCKVESEQPPGNPKLGIDQTTGAQKHKHGIIQQ